MVNYNGPDLGYEEWLKMQKKPYKCPVCGTNDPNLYLRCNRPDCTDGRDPR